MNAHQKGRDGDHLMAVPFECELCHYRNIRKRNPNWGSFRDQQLLMVMRRANLDACWGRATSTVTANLSRVRKDHKDMVQGTPLTGDEFLPHLGNPKLEDRVGMRVAVQVLRASLRPGKYAEFIQFDTIRKTRTWWNNAYNAGEEYNADAIFARDERKVVATTSPTSGEWFTRFMRGLKLRVGEIKKQNNPFTSEIVLALDKVCEEAWDGAEDQGERADIEDLMAYVLMEFLGDLRGEEVPLLSLKGILEFWNETTAAKQPHIMLTLHGKFKGETGLRWHCIPLPLHTKSKLPVGKWVSRCLTRRVHLGGRTTGWFFANEDGTRRKMKYYDALLQEHLPAVQHRFPDAIGAKTELDEFSLWRSGRSGAHSAATNNKVPLEVTEAMGRWRKRERAKGAVPNLPMRQVYLRMKLATPTLLAFASGF